MAKKFVTLKDVANYLGVSITTVYKVLKNHPDISPETREKVMKAVEELGYIKNDAASSLRSSKSYTIGFVVYGISNPFYEFVLRGIIHGAEDNGYEILISSITENSKERIVKAIEALMKKRVDGLILAADVTMLSKKDMKRFDLSEHAVAFGLVFSKVKMDMITPDNFKGGYIATKHLLDIGRKKIAILHTSDFEREKNLKERYQGYVNALKEAGIEVDERLVFVEEEASKREDAMYEAYKLIKNKLKEVEFDALFCYNDEVAYGAIEALKDEGVKIPDDVAVVGYDDLAFSKLISPSLTSITFDKFKLGYRAVEMLLERIENPNMKPRREFIDVDIVIRESTGGTEK